MSEAKILLKRNPRDSENGVWIDSVKVPDIKDIAVYSAATDLPQVIILPKKIVLGVDDPVVDKV